MKTCFTTIRLLAFLVLLISCKKESILEREASLSDKELLEKGQLIYFNGWYDIEHTGLFSGKLLSNDTVEITTIYDGNNYGHEAFPGYESPLMINSKNNMSYWVTEHNIYKADLSPSSNSVVKIGTLNDFYAHDDGTYIVDNVTNKIYFINAYSSAASVNSFDLDSYTLQRIEIESKYGGITNGLADYEGPMVYFDGYLYLYYYPSDSHNTSIIKLNIATGKGEKLFGDLISPDGLVIDKINKKLYVIDREGTMAIIREGNLDGTGKMEKILEIGLYYGSIFVNVGNLQYDQKNRYLFWYDRDKESIGRIKKGESSPKYWYMEYMKYGTFDFTVPEINNGLVL